MKEGILNCAACEQQLIDPITLSCGYTICLACFPSSAKHKVFPCTARGCKQKKHIFGPKLSKDVTILDILDQKSNSLVCSLCIRLFKDPITSHCGHTFCRICLLLDKLMSDICRICLKRLPSYKYIQEQPINLFIESVSQARLNKATAESSSMTNIHISFTEKTCYENIPIYLADFTILPTQRIQIPSTSIKNNILKKYTLKCSQDICFAIMAKDKATHQTPYGTIAKIETINHNANDVYVCVVGLHRFQVQAFHQDTQLMANIKLLMEVPKAIHGKRRRRCDLMDQIIHFIEGLSKSKRSTSFCNTMEGFLGPVWLQTAQAYHGTLPTDDPVALCWWTSIVLPVTNEDRYRLLETASLNDRLVLVLSWIRDLESKKDGYSLHKSNLYKGQSIEQKQKQ